MQADPTDPRGSLAAYDEESFVHYGCGVWDPSASTDSFGVGGVSLDVSGGPCGPGR
jgi:hypothetical protein